MTKARLPTPSTTVPPREPIERAAPAQQSLQDYFDALLGAGTADSAEANPPVPERRGEQVKDRVIAPAIHSTRAKGSQPGQLPARATIAPRPNLKGRSGAAITTGTTEPVLSRPPILSPVLPGTLPRLPELQVDTAGPQSDERTEAVQSRSAVIQEQAVKPEEVQPTPALRPRASTLHPPAPPAWAAGRFDCLLFSIGRLQLAVPLIALGGVIRLPAGSITRLFGQPEWFLGLFRGPTDTTSVRVVDTARWVMPDRYPADFKRMVTHGIRIHDSPWLLACTGIGAAFPLVSDEVKWRAGGGNRPWLAGTVIQRMCAIIDADALLAQLNTAARGARITGSSYDT